MIVFCDLDGTLIDSSRRHTLLLNTILREIYRGMPFDTADYLSMKADGMNTKAYLTAKGLPEADAGAIAAKWVRHIEDNEYLKLDTLYGDTIDFLSRQRHVGNDLVYATARNNADGLKASLSELGIDQFASDLFVVPPASAAAGKERIIRNIAGKDDALIGDTEADMQCACAVGIRCYVLHRGFRSKAFWQNQGIQSYGNLLEISEALQ